MRFRTSLFAASLALAASTASLSALAQAAPDSQWRTSPLTLSTLLQDGYRIVAVVNGAQGASTQANTIFVQRDQSAFKCIDPQQGDGRIKAVCLELAQPAGTAPASDAK